MEKIDRDNFARTVLENGGSLHTLILPASVTGGTGIMNPSVAWIQGKLCVNIRHVNYTFYHSETKLFQHPWGPLTYLHPDNDCTLTTVNYFCELDHNLNIVRYNRIDTSKHDIPPVWEFVGLEDVRLFEWDNRVYVCGVRRDVKTNGEGRMELCEIEVTPTDVREVSRWRMPPPQDPNSYCEKNWMPVEGMSNHFVKWSNPLELVKAVPGEDRTETVFMGKHHELPRDIRGGSQVIPWQYRGQQYWLAITHEVMLFNSEVGRKDGVYRHRFMLWDQGWNLAGYSHDFSIMNGHVEFSAGMCQLDHNHVVISYGFQDNAAYLLKVPVNLINDAIDEP